MRATLGALRDVDIIPSEEHDAGEPAEHPNTRIHTLALHTEYPEGAARAGGIGFRRAEEKATLRRYSAPAWPSRPLQRHRQWLHLVPIDLTFNLDVKLCGRDLKVNDVPAELPYSDGTS